MDYRNGVLVRYEDNVIFKNYLLNLRNGVKKKLDYIFMLYL